MAIIAVIYIWFAGYPMSYVGGDFQPTAGLFSKAGNPAVGDSCAGLQCSMSFAEYPIVHDPRGIV